MYVFEKEIDTKASKLQSSLFIKFFMSTFLSTTYLHTFSNLLSMYVFEKEIDTEASKLQSLQQIRLKMIGSIF